MCIISEANAAAERQKPLEHALDGEACWRLGEYSSTHLVEEQSEAANP
jgi:hypothetical protein